jgi:hypothetical protein
LCEGILLRLGLVLYLIVVGGGPLHGGAGGGELSHPSLQQVIDCVRSNEEKLALVKMNFSVDFTYQGEPPHRPRDPRASDKRLKAPHDEIEWAQDGIRQRFVHARFSEGSLWLNEISVVDGEVQKCADWPDLKRGSITEVSAYSRWMVNYASRLYYRPMYRDPDEWPLLSEVLASLDTMPAVVRQELDGRDVFVLDVPSGTVGCRRLYIDVERGLLLRSDVYSRPPDTEEAKVIQRIELTKVHQTDNGAWVALEGRQITYEGAYVSRFDVHVDVNSISVNRADIPDSLFHLDFPEHTIVTNMILRTVSPQKVDAIAQKVLDDLYAQEKQRADSNALEDTVIEESNVPTSPNEIKGAREILMKGKNRSEDSAGADKMRWGLAWMWGLRQLGLLSLVAGATILVLVIRRRNKP